MNHELANDLRKAGFPGTQSCQHEPDGVHKDGKVYTRDMCYFAVPTLSELIEAIRDERVGGYPKFTLEHDRTLGWQATLWSLADTPHAEGSTPEEAVARLWLALNKKA